MIIKALSLLQPWASLVSLGAKKRETRSWQPLEAQMPCWLAIHASARFNPEDRELLELPSFQTALAPILNLSQPADMLYKQLPLGAIVGIVWLERAEKITPENTPEYPERGFGDYTPNRYQWYLSNPIFLDNPIPAKGALSLWSWDTSALDFILPASPSGVTQDNSLWSSVP